MSTKSLTFDIVSTPTGTAKVWSNGVVTFFGIPYRSVQYRKAGPSDILSKGYVSYSNRSGLLHRTTGPAVIYSDGSEEYWVYGEKISHLEFFSTYGVL